jgi:translation initiation factor 2-alpha kinase 3
MERSFTLRDLKEGKLPEDFEKSTGEWGLPVAVLVKDMTEADEERRLTCLEVKARVEEILALVGAS